jgi:hypothetical protein
LRAGNVQQFAKILWDGSHPAWLAIITDVNTVVVEATRGADSKLYPAAPLSEAERDRARVVIHTFVCRDGLSVRQVQKRLLDDYGIRRAVGTIARDLKAFSCQRCPARRSVAAPVASQKRATR